MRNLTSTPPAVTWQISRKPATAQSQEKLLLLLRPHLQARLAIEPDCRELHWETPFGDVQVCRQGPASPHSADIRLVFSPDQPLIPRSDPATDKGGGPITLLPDAAIAASGMQLRGLAPIHDRVLQRYACRWDGALEAWSAQTGQEVPLSLQLYFQASAALFVFAGDPGTGKSVSAAVIADRYCREQEITGHLIRLGTEVRGNGTVGDFSSRIWAAFKRLASLPEDDLKVLVLEEAEAIGMRRSETQSHQEDRAGTSTILQCLDTYGGLRRLAVFCTTNLLESLDAAILRRSVSFTFERPDQKAREVLLADFLPKVSRKALAQMALHSEGMTGCDIVRTLTGVYAEAVGAGKAITVERTAAALKTQPRTGRV